MSSDTEEEINKDEHQNGEEDPGDEYETPYNGPDQQSIPNAGNQQRKSKMNPTSKLPKMFTTDKPTKAGPRIPRLAKSNILRFAPSKYPTDIPFAVRGLYTEPEPISNIVNEPLRSFLGILRNYMGHDPSSLTFDMLEDRILLSTKASDESDSEHFQRIASTMQIVNTIKRSRVDTLSELVTLAQKELNDSRQHERFSEAIRIKGVAADAASMKASSEKSDIEYTLEQKRLRENDVGYLTRKLEAQEMRIKLATMDLYPQRLLTYDLIAAVEPNDGYFKKRTIYFEMHV